MEDGGGFMRFEGKKGEGSAVGLYFPHKWQDLDLRDD
jgi:hypothetical protein